MSLNVLPELGENVKNWRREYTPGTLTPEEFEQFWEEGFVLKKDLFTASELSPVMESINGLVSDTVNRLYEKKKIDSKHEDLGFYQRLIAIEKEFPSASVLIHKKGILPEEIGNLWTDPRLLSVAKQILGGDVAAHPVWNLRSKVPRQPQATVPWHQDNAYLHPECWDVLQLTAWIPLINANLQNGCMQVIRGGHRSGKVLSHTCCAGGTWYVELPVEEMKKNLGFSNPEEDIPRNTVTCEVPLGSVLFLNNLIPHQSLENFSDSIRWSLDLRYQNPDFPNGFYGLKNSLPLIKSQDPNYQVDWKSVSWAKVNRQELQSKAVDVQVGDRKTEEDAEFDTTIAGPWMSRWPIVHHNRHTKAAEGLADASRPIDKA